MPSEPRRIVHQGDSPLIYNRGGRIQRFAVVDPEAALPDEPRRAVGTESHIRDTDYWHAKHIISRGSTGKPLKKPRTFNNPSAAAPGTVAFADFTDYGEGDAYVNYVTTRSDQRGQGHARQLLTHLAGQFSGHINLGKVMNPGIWKIKDELEAQGHSISGHRDF